MDNADTELQQKTESAKNEVFQYINQYASANATEDLLRSITVEAFEFMGETKTIIRDPANGNQIITKAQMLKKFEKERPGYLMNKATNNNNDVNAEYQQEKDSLMQQLADAATAKDFELFQEIRRKQKKMLQ